MLALLAAACIVAGKFVVPQETHIEPRGPLLVEEQAEEVAQMIEQGGEGISRRALLTGAGGVAGAALVTAAATPVASLGPRLRGIHDTPWQRGVRLVDDAGRPYLASDIEIGSFYTALPEGGDAEELGAGLLVVRLAGQVPAASAGAPGMGARGHPRLLEDLPARRVRDLAVPLSDLSADERRTRVHVSVPLLDVLARARAAA